MFIADLFDVNQIGKLNPMKTETPNMNKFLDEFIFTLERFDIPTAVIIPAQKRKILCGTPFLVLFYQGHVNCLTNDLTSI